MALLDSRFRGNDILKGGHNGLPCFLLFLPGGDSVPESLHEDIDGGDAGG